MLLQLKFLIYLIHSVSIIDVDIEFEKTITYQFPHFNYLKKKKKTLKIYIWLSVLQI